MRGMQQVVRWGQQLDALGGRIGAFIAHAAPRRRVTAYLRAVVGGVDRRNGWQLAEQAGEATPSPHGECVLGCRAGPR